MPTDPIHHDALGELPRGVSLDDLMAFVEGSMSPDGAARFESVLADHPALLALASGMRGDREALASLHPLAGTPAMLDGSIERAIDTHLAGLGESFPAPFPAEDLASMEARAVGGPVTAPTVVVRESGVLARLLPGLSANAARTAGWALAAGVVLALGAGVWTVAGRIGAGGSDPFIDPSVDGPGDPSLARNIPGAAEGVPLDGTTTIASAAEAEFDASAMARAATPFGLADAAPAPIPGARLASADEAPALAADGRLVIVVQTRRLDDLGNTWLGAAPTARFRVDADASRWARSSVGDAPGSLESVAGRARTAADDLAATLSLAAAGVRADASGMSGLEARARASEHHAETDGGAEDERGLDRTPTARHAWTVSLDRASGIEALERAAAHAGARVLLLALPEEGASVPVAPRASDLLWWGEAPEDWPERSPDAWVDAPVVIDVLD